MNTQPPPFSPTAEGLAHDFGGNGVNGASRAKMNGNAVPLPVHDRSSSASFSGMQREYSGMGPFAGARSPPKAKNTSHVPCKFYPHGTCQAGAACQFSHDLDPMTQNAPCKYFAKGSCKFGQGCALAHVLPDGRVINRPPRGAPFAYSRRSQIPSALPPGPPSLLSMQANDLASQSEYPYFAQGAENSMAGQYLQGATVGGPMVDAGMAAERGSHFGSPPNDSRLGASPSNRGLSVLDAPLPSSFDSQGISHAARHGPFASSVPPRFGIESPPSSLPNKAFLGNGAGFRGLHDTTFGDAANLDGVLHNAGSSPPTFDEPLTFSKRPLHSERLARPKMMMSASLGTRPSHFALDSYASDESEEEGIGEDLLPSSLHELLPQDKLRRFSRHVVEDDSNPLFLSAQRRAISNGNTPSDSKVGSLSPLSASPSRYNSLWSVRSNTESNSLSGAFGHVGSPLRPSTFRSSSLNVSTSASSDASPWAVGSPPKQANMSMLTQGLQRTTLGDHNKSTPSPMHSGVARSISNGPSSGRSNLMERGISNNSLGRETIEEEQGLFSMEEEDAEHDASSRSSATAGASTGSSASRSNGNKNGGLNTSPVFGMTPGKSEATLGPIGGQRSK